MTFIKSIKLHGFKSFAKPTELLFGDGFNTILGPNGAGKSNVMDGFCFVLGKISAKSMRAERAANLIYNGGKKSSPAKHAEVSIIFDNSNKKFPIDAKEVIVSRIVTHRGISKYRINNEKRTRQEVLELLNHARIDIDGHNIILQGDIGHFINMKTVDRRQLIEEIAGISVYEEKKEKALKELEKVQVKVSEAEIILTEREAHLRELKKDRDQALKYKNLEGKIKQNKATVLNRQIKKKKEKLDEIEGKIKIEKENIDKLNSQISKTKEEINSKKQEIDDINSKIEERGEKGQRALTSSISDLKAQIARDKTRLDVCKNEIKKINSRKEQLDNNLQELTKKIKELEDKKSALEKKSVKKEPPEISKKKSELEKILKELNKVLSLDSTFANQLDNARTKLLKEQEQQARLTGRRESIKEFTSGDVSIKKILALNNKNIYGLVSELGKVDSKYSLALEVAAGPRIKSIVVKDDITAASLIKYLKDNKLGVVTFLPLNKMKKKETEDKIKQLLNFSGVKGFAKDLVSYDKKFENIFSYVFGLTLVVDDISTARNIGIGRVRMVTIDGDLLEPSGAMIGGFRRSKGLSFQEKDIDNEFTKSEDEISRLKKSLSIIERDREENGKRIDELRTIKVNLESEIFKYEQTADSQKSNEIRNIEIQISDIHLPEKIRTEEILKENQKELKDFKEELASLTEKLKEEENISKQSSKKEQTFYTEFKNLFNKRNKRNEEVQKKEQLLQNEQIKIKEIENKINDINIDRAKLVAESEALEKEYEPFKDEKIRKGADAEELKKEIAEFEKLLSNIGNVNLRALEIYEEIEKQYQNILEKNNSLKQEKEDVLKMIQEIESQKTDAFMKTFNVIKKDFTNIFAQLSTKGEATLEVENREEPLKEGIEIKVRIIGDKFLDTKSLSGGEQTLAALAFIFAIQEHQPASFYLLDEVDAALDRRNSEKLSQLIKKYSGKAQYIMITHNDSVISDADQIYGVSMQEHGVSKIVSLKL